MDVAAWLRGLGLEQISRHIAAPCPLEAAGSSRASTKPPVSVTPIPLGDRLRVAGPVETSPPVAEENTIDLRRNLA